MALITGNLLVKSPGPLSIAIYEVANVMTGDTFTADFSNVKNAIFYPTTIDNWVDANRELPLVEGSLTTLLFDIPNLEHEAGWLVVVGGSIIGQPPT